MSMAEWSRLSRATEWSSVVAGVVFDGDMSQASITGAPINAETLSQVSWQLKWAATGTPVGAIDIQASNNFDRGKGTGDWITVPRSLISGWADVQATGVSGEHLIQVEDWPATWLRLIYTRTSGSGTLRAWAFGRQ